MKMSEAREDIFKRLKKAVHKEPEKPDFESSVYHSIDTPLEEAFKENLEKVNGHVHIFNSDNELYKALKSFLSVFYPENICCREADIQEKLNSFKIAFSECSDVPETIQAGITGCEYLIAHTGSAMVSSAQKSGRQMFIYPPVHIIVASKKQLVKYLDDAYSAIQEKYNKNLPSQISIITGPSRTADIEKTLILGAHGPKELHVFIV